MKLLILILIVILIYSCKEEYVTLSKTYTCQSCGHTNVHSYNKFCPQCKGRIVTASVFANPEALQSGLTWVL